MTKTIKKFRQIVIPMGAPLKDVTARLRAFNTGDAFVLHLRAPVDYMPALEYIRCGGARQYLSSSGVPVVGITLLKGDLKTLGEVCSDLLLQQGSDGQPLAGCAVESTMEEMRRTLLSIEVECVEKAHLTFHVATLKVRVFEDAENKRYLDFSL